MQEILDKIIDNITMSMQNLFNFPLCNEHIQTIFCAKLNELYNYIFLFSIFFFNSITFNSSYKARKSNLFSFSETFVTTFP